MKLKNTIVILIIAIIAFGLLLWDETQKTSEELRESEKNIFNFKSDDVTKLTIDKKDGEKIVCVKDKKKDSWEITKPIKARADKWSVNSIVNEIKDLKWERKLSKEKGKTLKLKDYGLDKPKVIARVKLKEKEGKAAEHEILVGTEVGNSIFIKLKGKPDIYRVKKWLYDKLNKDVNEIRDKTVVEVEKDKVTKVALKYDGTSIEVEKVGDKWHIKQPITDRGDTGEIEKVINKVKNLRVPSKDDFVNDEPKPKDIEKYGLKEPNLIVTLWEGKSAKIVKFGKKLESNEKKVYCKSGDSDFVYAVNKSDFDDIKKDPTDLRDKKVARFKTEDAEKITLTHGKETIEIAKKDDKWKITKPTEMKTDENSVKDFLKKATEAKVKKFGPEKPKPEELEKFGLKEPAVEVAIKIKGQEQPEKFVLGTKKGKGKEYYARRSESNSILTVEDEKLYKLATRGYLPFLNKKVLNFNKKDVKKLTVKREDKTFVCLKTKDDKWKIEQPIKFDGDKSRIDNILNDMDDLEAKEFVAESPKDLKEYGLDKPLITATVEYEIEQKKTEAVKKNEAKEEKKSKGKTEKKKAKEEKEEKPKKKVVTKSLLIGKKAEGNDSYAKIADGKFVFTLQSWRVNDFKKELADRQIIKFNKDDAKKVTLTYPTKEIVYEKKGNKWQMTKPENKEAKKSDVDDILNTLDNFKGDDIATYSAPKEELKKYGLDKPQLKVTIALEKGQKVVLVGNKTSENKFYIKSPDSNFVFLAYQWDVNKLMKEKPKKEKKPAAKKIKNKAPQKQPTVQKKQEKKPAAVKSKSASPAQVKTKPKRAAGTQEKQEEKKAPPQKPGVEQKKK